jgi:hypothetical protein
MADKRITKRDRFAQLAVVVSKAASQGIITVDEHDALQGFMKHEVALLTKKHGGNGVKTKSQRINDGIKVKIATELAKSPEGIKATPLGQSLDLSVQKVSALLRQMVADGAVVRDDSGKDTLFSLAPAEGVETE